MYLRTTLLAAAVSLFALAPVARCDFDTIVGWDNQLFTSYLISTATMKSDPNASDEKLLGDPLGQFGVIVNATEDTQTVWVSISCPGFFEASEFSGTLATDGESYVIKPKILYNYEKLSGCRQSTPATITYRVQLGSGPIEEISKTATFRSINDCPLVLRLDENSESVEDVSFTFAAYVNEQHPFVDKLLREALDIGTITRFTGYQTNDPREVIRQVYALWDLMIERDVRYSSITTTVGNTQLVGSQAVRLIEDSVNNAQANCVDGSVLFVSMLRKIGIEAFLVLEPGHCYVGFYLEPNSDKILGIETTAMDMELKTPKDPPKILAESIEKENRGQKSWASFVLSISHATDKLLTDEEKFKSETEVEYRKINIARARSVGVLPIPFDGKEEFDWYAYDEEASVASDEDEEDETYDSAEEEEADEEDDLDDEELDEDECDAK